MLDILYYSVYIYYRNEHIQCVCDSSMGEAAQIVKEFNRYLMDE